MGAIEIMSTLARHVDDAETLADDEFWTVASASKPALCNLLARISKLQQTVQMAARSR
jgi:hypothetical protein